MHYQSENCWLVSLLVATQRNWHLAAFAYSRFNQLCKKVKVNVSSYIVQYQSLGLLKVLYTLLAGRPVQSNISASLKSIQPGCN